MQILTSPRSLLLLDGLGAACSCFMLRVILNAFPDFFGVPSEVLTRLSMMAAVLSVFALVCYCIFSTKRRSLLQVVSAGNLIYCFVTMVMLISIAGKIKWPGWIYFIAELSCIVLLARAEWSAGRSSGT